VEGFNAGDAMKEDIHKFRFNPVQILKRHGPYTFRIESEQQENPNRKNEVITNAFALWHEIRTTQATN
jgi:hypothetical protein